MADNKFKVNDTVRLSASSGYSDLGLIGRITRVDSWDTATNTVMDTYNIAWFTPASVAGVDTNRDYWTDGWLESDLEYIPSRELANAAVI